MNAVSVAVYARREIRRSRVGLLAIALLTAASSAFVMTAMMGARRSETAYRRFAQATHSPNLMISTPPAQTDYVVAALAGEPGVRATSMFSWVPLHPKEVADDEIGGFAALAPDFLTPIVLEGRLADPARTDEFTINRKMQQLTGLRVGDRTTLVSVLPGALRDATLVGVVKGPFDVAVNQGDPTSYFSVAIGAQLRHSLEEMAGEAYRPAVTAETDATADVNSIMADLAQRFPDVGLVNAHDFSTELRHALSTEAHAYWALTIAAAAAALVALGQVLSRALRQHERDAAALRALGSRPLERVAILAAPLVLATGAGLAVAFACEYPLSALVPSGLGAHADPTAGPWVDWRGLVMMTAALALLLIGSIAVAGRAIGQPATPVNSSHAHLPNLIGGSAAGLLGARAALGGPDAISRHAARNAVFTTALAVAGVLGVFVWTASLTHLRNSPKIYGWDFDLAVDTILVDPANQSTRADELAQQLASSDAVSRVERMDVTTTSLQSVDVDIWTLSSRRGSLHPTLQAGRAPVAADEIALGKPILERLHAKVGQTVDISGKSMTVVGQAVFPLVANGNFGFMGSVSPAGAEALGLIPYASYVLVGTAPGKGIDDVRAIVGDRANIQSPSPPDAVEFLNEAGPANNLLALFLAFLALATIVHALAVSARRRLHDYATARALGLRRNQLRRVFAWHGLLMTAAAIVIAVPVGVLAGRVIWSLATRNVPVLDAFRVPALTTSATAAVVIAATLVIALGIAAIAGRRALGPALRTE